MDFRSSKYTDTFNIEEMHGPEIYNCERSLAYLDVSFPITFSNNFFSHADD